MKPQIIGSAIVLFFVSMHLSAEWVSVHPLDIRAHLLRLDNFKGKWIANHLDQKNDLCKGCKQARWAQEAEGQHTRVRHSICRS